MKLKRISRIRWELYDPWDGMILGVVDMPTPTREDRVRVRKMIQRAPVKMRPLGRPDGKPIGLRTLRTRTTLFYDP